MSFNENVVNWAWMRNIPKSSTADKQRTKTWEETGKMVTGISNNDMSGLKDGIGNCAVMLINMGLCMSVYDMVAMEKNVNKMRPLINRGLDVDQLVNQFTYAVASIVTNTYTHIDKNFTCFVLAFATLAAIAEKFDLTFEECQETAWNDIKDRRGMLVDSTYVKEADLEVALTTVLTRNLKLVMADVELLSLGSSDEYVNAIKEKLSSLLLHGYRDSFVGYDVGIVYQSAAFDATGKSDFSTLASIGLRANAIFQYDENHLVSVSAVHSCAGLVGDGSHDLMTLTPTRFPNEEAIAYGTLATLADPIRSYSDTQVSTIVNSMLRKNSDGSIRAVVTTPTWVTPTSGDARILTLILTSRNPDITVDRGYSNVIPANVTVSSNSITVPYLEYSEKKPQASNPNENKSDGSN